MPRQVDYFEDKNIFVITKFIAWKCLEFSVNSVISSFPKPRATKNLNLGE